MGTETGAEVIGTGTHVGEAVPEVLEGAIMIDVQVCMIFFFHFGSQNSLGIDGDRRGYRYDDRRDPDRRDRDDRRRDDRRDDRDRHRDDPRDSHAPKNLEARPSPGLKEESGKCWNSATSQDVNPVSSPSDPRTTRTE